MCEQCERNTKIKRGATDALLTPNPSAPDAEVPGYREFLTLGRTLEHISRLPLVEGRPDPEAVEQARAEVVALTPEQRSDVLRVVEYFRDLLKGIWNAVGTAKVQLRDADTGTLAVAIQDGAVVVLVNGKEVSRTPLDPDADQGATLDAAERAMQAHRDAHGQS